MKYALPLEKKMPRAMVTARVSQKKTTKVCRVINRKKFSNAKIFLEKMKKKETSMKGKYYTKTVEEILKLLNQLEINARSQNIEPEKMFLYISPRQGPTMRRGRRRWNKFGTKMKICHIQAALGEKNGFRKEVRKRGNKE
jgi:ribosomal protein L22